MRVTVVHNELAGGTEPSAGALMHAIRAEGHEPTYWSSRPDDVARAIEAPGDLVAVAGGDGTVVDVASRLVNRGVPIAVIPAGTANNIATSLGIVGDWRAAIAGWTRSRRRPVDLGWVSGKPGTFPFIESVGCGLIADLMLQFEADKSQPEPDSPREEVDQARRKCHELLLQAEPKSYRVELDGQDFSGRYLLVEAMNIGRLGPGLPLAPEADTRDGMLDVVLLTENDRDLLSACLQPPRETPPDLAFRRARQVLLDPGTNPLHIGGEPWPREKLSREAPGSVRISVQERALIFLTPGEAHGGS